MKGKLKFVDGKTGSWGFIIPADGSPDLHFVQRDVGGGPLVRSQAGVDLEFDIDEDASGRHARRVRLVDTLQPEAAQSDASPAPIPEPRPFVPRSSPGDELSQWAYMVFHDFVSGSGRTVLSDLPQLAKMALDERWYFGAAADPRNPYPILENYLKFTFFRLRREGKVAEVVSSGGKWAVFNTELVDKLYDPIFALFQENDRKDLKLWRFYAFCVPGKAYAGKQLTSVFDPLPEPASYFQSNFDMLLDTSKDIHVDYDHVILDGVSRDRFSPEFLAQHAPKAFGWKDYTALDRNDREQYLTELAQDIESDVQTMRAIKRRLEDAKLLAEKRTSGTTRPRFRSTFPAKM